MKTMKTLIMLTLIILAISGCESENNAQLPENNTDNQDKNTSMTENGLNKTVQDLLVAASKNEISKLNEISGNIKSDDLNQVLVQVLLQWHQYKYPEHGDLYLVQTLLEEGADPNSKVNDPDSNDNGRPALYLARGADMLKTLLKDPDADIHVKDSSGSTLLIAAIAQRNLEKVILLLDQGVDPNEMAVWAKPDIMPNQTIPVFLAIQYDQTDGFQIVNTLIEAKGINLDIQNEEGLTPRQFAEKIKNPNVAELLKINNIP